MNTFLTYLLVPLALLAGCRDSSQSERVGGSGYFELTNGTGTVLWGHLQDSQTNDIQFVLLLSETARVETGGSQARGNVNYDYYYLKTKRDSHLWKIEAIGNMKTGTKSLRLSDLTDNTVTDINLRRSRLWQISDDKVLTPLDKIDPTITEKVLHESESGFKQIQSLRNET